MAFLVRIFHKIINSVPEDCFSIANSVESNVSLFSIWSESFLFVKIPVLGIQNKKGQNDLATLNIAISENQVV